ncbi:MAG TPA: helix-turn-helix domain-containing protein [Candidatus Woesebacteria bacterium]|nr:helix-turn-helix domain-containing protein [Candidatus Woesebacteria bacterium]
MDNKKVEYYTLEEVSEMLKVAYLTVYRWVRSGKLEAVKAGKQYRVSQIQLDKFLENK